MNNLVFTALLMILTISLLIVVIKLCKKNNENKKLLRDLNNANSVLKNYERLKNFGEMASGVVHDLNNILFPIMGLSETLINVNEKLRSVSDIKQIYKSINIAAKDGLNIINRLRELYVIKKTKKHVKLINIDDLLRDVVNLSKAKIYSRNCETLSSIQINTVLDAKGKVKGTEHELREIFMNLVFNAADAVKENGLINIKSESDEKFVSITIEDNGIGMSDDVKNKCMEPFYTSKGEAGTGMGLSIAHDIIRCHNGKIELASAQNSGSKFYVYLPVAAENISTVEVCNS